MKHFKYVPRGKIRLHQKPVTVEIKACRQWLERELDFVQPKVAVAMGATAAQSLFGKAMPINKNRGRLVDLGPSKALITIHPSYLLRIQEEADARAEYRKVCFGPEAAAAVSGAANLRPACRAFLYS